MLRTDVIYCGQRRGPTPLVQNALLEFTSFLFAFLFVDMLLYLVFVQICTCTVNLVYLQYTNARGTVTFRRAITTFQELARTRNLSIAQTVPAPLSSVRASFLPLSLRQTAQKPSEQRCRSPKSCHRAARHRTVGRCSLTSSYSSSPA